MHSTPCTKGIYHRPRRCAGGLILQIHHHESYGRDITSCPRADTDTCLMDGCTCKTSECELTAHLMKFQVCHHRHVDIWFHLCVATLGRRVLGGYTPYLHRVHNGLDETIFNHLLVIPSIGSNGSVYCSLLLLFQH